MLAAGLFFLDSLAEHCVKDFGLLHSLGDWRMRDVVSRD